MSEASQLPLRVCGVTQEIAAVGNRESKTIALPSGTPDYSLLFCLGGQVIFRFSNHSVYIAKKGDVILFRPQEPQEYRLGGHYQTFSVSFSAQAPDSLLPTLFQASPVCALGSIPLPLRHCMEALYAEYHLGLDQSEAACAGHLLLLLTYLRRSAQKSAYLTPPGEFFKLLPAVASIENDYAANLAVADYAAMCRLSEYYFIRFFHKYKGTSPCAYRTAVRIRHACRLLLQTDQSVAEIAQAVGYTDAVHFGKQFKAQTGLSPLRYRKNVRNEKEISP